MTAIRFLTDYRAIPKVVEFIRNQVKPANWLIRARRSSGR